VLQGLRSSRRSLTLLFGISARMKIFEVIFWGSKGKEEAKDTIYLVRATDFRAAEGHHR